MYSERELERSEEKTQRIKRDRMLTNFMSLLLEGRLFVWRFLIWDLSPTPLSRINKNTISLSQNPFFSFIFVLVVERESGPVDRNLLSFVQSGEDLSFFNGVATTPTFLFVVLLWLFIGFFLSLFFGCVFW